MARKKFSTLLSKFRAKINGNVAMTFGIAMIPIMLSVGTAVDYSRYSNLQTKVASATDAALLAATASAMNSVDLNDKTAVLAELNSIFEPFFLANMGSSVAYQYNSYTLDYNVATRKVSVNIDIDYQTVVMGIVGFEELKADTNAVASLEIEAGGAVSMYLVLDRSGSMGWSNGEGGTKMETLQSSVAQMITTMSAADPDQEFIRMGAVAYSHYTWGEKSLRWNLSKINQYVQNMYADGGTDSSGAVEKAYKKLKKQKEIDKHAAKSGQIPDLVIVFMTDGDNNYSSADTETLDTCTKAKNYGMTIYTVAYQAPANGQALLNSCATSEAHYFEADDADELATAFSNIGANVAKSLVLSQ